ncbi:MAG TPA: hypothetical protein VKD72_29725 [Gemmataceae bacterium]|nr:hypothetical protein [Gemmataceae bacterium]
MKPDSMLVEPGYIVTAHEEIATNDRGEALTALAGTEPALASFICECLATVAGKLALSGAPTPVVQGAHEDVLTLVLTCVQALRRGHYELWKDSLEGTPLARIQDEATPPPKPRRRKKRGNE